MPPVKPGWSFRSASTNATAAPSTTQLLFDADGTLIQRRRKITPTYHERMIWGQGDGSGLRAVDSAAGRIGQLACWEHHQPGDRDPEGFACAGGAMKMRQAFGDRATMVTADQGGHGVYPFSRNTCANNTVTTFLTNGQRPAEDLACAAEPNE